jgi:hypothetical protein
VQVSHERPGQAEVHDLGCLDGHQQDVGRLEVAADDPQAMRSPDGAGQHRNYPRRRLG